MAGRHRNDLIDDAEAEQIVAGEAQARRGFLGLARIAPENRGAAFRRRDGVHGVLEHDDVIREREGERAAALELALEALYLAKRIDKVSGEGQTVYG